MHPASFFSDAELVKRFEDCSIPSACDEDRVLFFEGEASIGFYILFEGAATFHCNASPEDSVIFLHTTAPSIIGLPSAVDGLVHPFTAVVHSGSKIGFVERNDLLRHMQAEPRLSLRVVLAFANEIEYVHRALLDQIWEGYSPNGDS